MNIKDGINKVASHLNFPLVDASITVWLKVDGKEYEAEQFKIGFSQPIDFKGEPQCETKGGQLMLTLTEALPESFYEWVIKSRQEKDGEVVFKIESGNAPLKIEFFRATCINFERNVSSNEGLQTYLVLSPERLLVNGVEHDNFWKE